MRAAPLRMYDFHSDVHRPKGSRHRIATKNARNMRGVSDKSMARYAIDDCCWKKQILSTLLQAANYADAPTLHTSALSFPLV